MFLCFVERIDYTACNRFSIEGRIVSLEESALIGAVKSFDWGEAGRILLGVSGGADSVALLHALVSCGVDCGVAHVDHGTRAGASAEDAAWVKALADGWDVPHFGSAVDVPELAAASRESFEEVARRVRYEYFSEVARLNDYSGIATAHHLDDQAETVLMRVLRGTSITGLRGIDAYGDWKGLPVFRPLLKVSRVEILEYLREHDLSWREDVSNVDESFLRNRIRQTLMPLLEESFNPGVKVALDRLARVARDEDALLSEWASKAYGYCTRNPGELDREAFRKLDVALRRRVMLEVVRRAGGIEELERIDAAVEFVCWQGTGKHLDLGGGHQLSNGREVTLVVQRSVGKSGEAEVELTIPGEVVFGGVRISAAVLDERPDGPLSEYCSASRQVISADGVQGALGVRYRKAGDRIALLGMEGSRKLKDYFGDLGLPLEVRDATPLVVVEDEVAWVVGYALSRSFAVTNSSQTLVQIEVHDEGE